MVFYSWLFSSDILFTSHLRINLSETIFFKSHHVPWHLYTRAGILICAGLQRFVPKIKSGYKYSDRAACCIRIRCSDNILMQAVGCSELLKSQHIRT
jgi:hypothetical protein